MTAPDMNPNDSFEEWLLGDRGLGLGWDAEDVLEAYRAHKDATTRLAVPVPDEPDAFEQWLRAQMAPYERLGRTTPEMRTLMDVLRAYHRTRKP